MQTSILTATQQESTPWDIIARIQAVADAEVQQPGNLETRYRALKAVWNIATAAIAHHEKSDARQILRRALPILGATLSDLKENFPGKPELAQLQAIYDDAEAALKDGAA